MPSDVLTPERASTLSGLDTTIVSDGVGIGAHGRRELERNANRLISRSELAVRLSWDAEGIAGESMGADDLHGWGHADRWTELTPRIPIEKFPFLTSYTAYVTAYLTEDSVHYLQLETRRWPFNPSANVNSPNVITLNGPGGGDDWIEAGLSTLLAQPGVSDYVRLWFKSEPMGAMSTGTYGSPNTGTIDSVPGIGPTIFTIEDASATWSTGGSTPANGGHMIEVVDSNGLMVTPPSMIIANTATTLTFAPVSIAGVPIAEAPPIAFAILIGKTYSLTKLPTFRFADFALYAKGRTP